MSKFIAIVLLGLIANGVVLASQASFSSAASSRPLPLNSPAANLFTYPGHPVATTSSPSPTEQGYSLPLSLNLASTPLPTIQVKVAHGETPIVPRALVTATEIVSRIATRGPGPTPRPNTITLEDFAKSIQTGRSDLVVGVYVPNILALRVVQQPEAGSSYIYPVEGYATQFELAARFGTTALLAHNYLSGARFFELSPGEPADLVYGNGAIRRYTISKLRHFQALRPDDPFSTFVDLDNGRDSLSSDQLFRQIYSDTGHVIFQTCIKHDGNPSWGRLFVIATPL